MTGAPNAGLVSRLAALTVDVAVLMVVCPAVSVLPGVAAQQVTGRDPGWLSAISAVIASLLPLAYFAGCWWVSGQTAGDLLMGIAVRKHGGGDVGPFRAILRAALGLALFPVWLIGLVGVLFDADRRAWHDRLFGTEVVSTA